jgi:HPt (histidine-containing phosphotransfer) domain-containing protein
MRSNGIQDDRPPLLDRSILDRICERDTQVRQDLVGLFADRADAGVADMGRAIQVHDSEALQNDADRLGLSSASMGALRMAEICERLAKAGRTGALSHAYGLLGELERASRMTRAAWYAELSVALAAPDRS